MQQMLGVVTHRPHPLRGHRLGHHRGHRGAVRHHVRHPGRHPDVVLQHPHVAGRGADQVDAGDLDTGAVGRVHPVQHPMEVFRGGDQRARDHPVGDRLLVVVRVVEERLQGADPLPHAALDDVPVPGGDDPRDDVQRERALDPADVEGHPGGQVVVRQRLGDGPEVARPHPGDHVRQQGVRLPDRAPGVHHLVERDARTVVGQHVCHDGTLCHPGRRRRLPTGPVHRRVTRTGRHVPAGGVREPAEMPGRRGCR
ncbi:hypothetical protein SDC9_101812 [bioreactor metagenome]|uniref:Uncharacterized protein n=1 Tax=bioreactor metagenome TaxID=1076179 RepID=A0A645APN9_9ZZZZ